MRTSYNFTFSTTAEQAERILFFLKNFYFQSFNLPILFTTLNYYCRKKSVLGKPCFTFIAGILSHCLVLYDILRVGIIE